MKADIIVLGYDRKFAVNSAFDLNALRNLVPVKEVGKVLIPNEEDYSGIEIQLGKQVKLEKREIEEAEERQAKKDAEQYRGWWLSEQTKTKKQEEEIKCLRLELERKGEEAKDGDGTVL